MKLLKVRERDTILHCDGDRNFPPNKVKSTIYNKGYTHAQLQGKIYQLIIKKSNMGYSVKFGDLVGEIDCQGQRVMF